MAEGIIEVEYHPGEEVVLRLKAPTLPFVPEAAKGPLRMAHKEMLLALRSFLDTAIERTEKAEKTKKRTKIEVQ
jgi:hypothetical protein